MQPTTCKLEHASYHEQLFTNAFACSLDEFEDALGFFKVPQPAPPPQHTLGGPTLSSSSSGSGVSGVQAAAQRSFKSFTSGGLIVCCPCTSRCRQLARCARSAVVQACSRLGGSCFAGGWCASVRHVLRSSSTLLHALVYQTRLLLLSYAPQAPHG